MPLTAEDQQLAHTETPSDDEDNLAASPKIYKPYKACPVCLCEHDDDIHAATLSVRARFRAEVASYFWPAEDEFSANEFSAI